MGGIIFLIVLILFIAIIAYKSIKVVKGTLIELGSGFKPIEKFSILEKERKSDG